jgi:hypothetical protein
MPSEVIQASDHDRNRSLGFLTLAWLEHFVVHGPGDVQGRPLNPNDPDGLPLDDEFAGLIVDHYSLEKSGRRHYDSAFTSRAKGRSKSELAAFEVLFEAFGPCRFLGFAKGGEVFEWRDFRYEYLPGEPMGKPIVYPFIRCLATEEDQSGNTYDNVYFNLTNGPLSEGLGSSVAGLGRVLIPGGGEIVPSTAASASKDGGKETHSVFDESHLYTTPELRRMYRTVRRNMAKRKDAEPWSHETSTMYLPGEGSVAEETHDLAKKIREKRVKRSRLYFNHVEGPPIEDLGDEKLLIAALRETYGPFADVMDLRRIVDEIWDPRNEPQDSRRYYLNQPTSSADAWLTDHEWKACAAPEKVVSPSDAITLGFDGSKSRKRGLADATALVGCRVSDGHSWLIAAWEQPEHWLPPSSDPESKWEVPAVEVDAAVASAFAKFKVVGFYADPAKWESYVASWEAKYLRHLRIKSNQKHPIEWWINQGRSIIVTRAIEQLHTAIIGHQMTHDGGFVLTRHVLNARRRKGPSGIWIDKEHPDSARKIDAAWALIAAHAARIDALAKGLGKTTHSVPKKLR